MERITANVISMQPYLGRSHVLGFSVVVGCESYVEDSESPVSVHILPAVKDGILHLAWH